jgi:DNA-binding PadR family transcriptional regulator
MERNMEKKLINSLILFNQDKMVMKVLDTLYHSGREGLPIERLMEEIIGEKGTWDEKHTLYKTLIKLSHDKLIEKETSKCLYFKLTDDGVSVMRTQKLIERTVFSPVTKILSTEIDNKEDLQLSLTKRYLSTLNLMLK